MQQTRNSFTGKVGFVLAAAGSAVGLGNIWRFPYLAAKYGGGVFLLVYIVLVITFGFALMVAEVAIGRRTGLSAVGAYRALDKRFSFLGYLTSLVPIIVLPYYCVIGGWVTKFLFSYAAGQGAQMVQDSFFNNFIAQPVEPVLWLCLFVGATALIVFLGVESGIEKASRFMMPVLVVLSVAVSVYSVTRPGALAGIKYYLIPDFSRFSPVTVLAAMGQMFYSMSLAMGIMVTYGSYMKKDTDLEKSVSQIELFDTGMAFVAGLMIVPAVFAFSNGDESALNAGASLMFITLPKVFADAGTLGYIAGGVFFLLVLFAALTSSVSLMETVVSIFRDKFGWGRKGTCLLVTAGCLLLALPSSLGHGVWSGVTIFGMNFREFFDFISNNVIMPVVAFVTCIFVGYFIKPKLVEDEVLISSAFRRRRMFEVVIKYIAPVFIVLILVSSLLDALGIMTI